MNQTERRRLINDRHALLDTLQRALVEAVPPPQCQSKAMWALWLNGIEWTAAELMRRAFRGEWQ